METECCAGDRRLTDFVAGELPLSEARAVEAHLRRCDRCRAEAEGLRRLFEAIGDVAPVEPEPALAQRTRAAVREAMKRRRGGWLDAVANGLALLVRRPAYGMASSVLVAALVLYLVVAGLQPGAPSDDGVSPLKRIAATVRGENPPKESLELLTNVRPLFRAIAQGKDPSRALENDVLVDYAAWAKVLAEKYQGDGERQALLTDVEQALRFLIRQDVPKTDVRVAELRRYLRERRVVGRIEEALAALGRSAR